MKKIHNKVIFDEVHHVPELFPLIKYHVDKNPEQKGRFILTASAQFTLMKSISESLAGRIGLLTLLPFSRGEIFDYADDSIEFKGSYPELVMRRHKSSQQWYSTYIHRNIFAERYKRNGTGWRFTGLFTPVFFARCENISAT